LRDVLRATTSDAEVADFIKSVVLKKEPRHRINDPGFLQPARTMSFIGG
jgi:cyclic pyranopterin phosphate synthase